jgi:acetyl esterase/lipase
VKRQTSSLTFLFPGCLALLSWGCVEDSDDTALPVPAELSQGAKDFYALRPQPIEGLDLDDREAVANARAAIEEAWRAVLPNIGLTPIEDQFEIAGVKVNLISWATMRDDGRLVIYLHGGAYVVGSATANIVLPARLANASGIPVLSIDYRLAPESPFPAALEDAVAVLGKVYEQGQDPRKLVLMGDSAGGGLALAATLRLRQMNVELPAALVLISPWTDLTRSGDTNTTLESADPIITWGGTLARPARAYAADADTANPLISPVYADYAGMPPMLVQAGSREILLSDSVRLVRKARRAGVDVRFDVWDGMWHVFQVHPAAAEAEEAIAEMAAFVLDVMASADAASDR